MIKRYVEFINESLEFLIESDVIYSDNFRRLLTKIDTEISKKLLDIENKDLNVQSNYFDIKLDKNDKVTFTPDRKAQEILKNKKETFRFTGSSGGWLKHKSSNNSLFEKLGYTYEEGTEPYRPNSRDIGEIIAKVTSESSGNTYAWIKWKGGTGTSQQGVDLGQGVYNVDKITPTEDNSTKIIFSTNRQEVAIGRATRALLKTGGQDFLDKDIEQFVNLYKSTIDKMNDKFSFFEVVKGSDIAHWYSKDNYFQRTGTLGNSCMASADDEWLEIYTENPEQVRMVIFKSPEDEKKILGRALLWKLIDGKEFMDRIYTVNDSDVQLFRDYAKENGWYAKFHNSSTTSSESYAPDGNKERLNLVVQLSNKRFDHFPYLDTLKYFNPRTGKIKNESSSGDYTLEDTGGGYINCDYCGGSGNVECGECGGNGREDCYKCDGDGEVDCSECSGEKTVDCTNCDGTGHIENDEGESEDCSECDATGNVKCSECGGSGQETCSRCDGDGYSECSNCDGRGEYSCPECN